ncbi:MAG: hypothetical protein JWM34_2287 [Ilumatobacteraceae bacterium]|nr:hypothetical protein [Ilumatobacteraceae bacterium]
MAPRRRDDVDMRRLLFVVVALFAVLTPMRALAASPAGAGGDAAATPATAPPATTPTTAVPTTIPSTTIDNQFLDTKRELSECLNDSIGLPGCGIKPTQPGDRGGVLQGVTFGLLALGIFIICWRVVRSVKARDISVGSRSA